MALAVNAQFGKFLEFAQSQANAASSKAVARIVDDEKGEKAPLAGRNITVTTGDEVHRWERTDAEKSANDKTRAAFRKAVADMFGEERLMDAIKAVPEPDPKMACNIVRMAVAAFAEGVPQADDLTVLAVEYVARPMRFVRSFPPTQEGIASASEYLDECFGDNPDVEREGARELGSRLSPLVPALHVILDEICSNIVKHSGASGFEVDVELIAEPAGVKLTFADDGEPYDPLSHKDPDTTLPAEERPIGGLGIMMVRKMSESMSYERVHDRNYLTVVMR